MPSCILQPFLHQEPQDPQLRLRWRLAARGHRLPFDRPTDPGASLPLLPPPSTCSLVEAAAGEPGKKEKNRELQENNGWTLTCHLGLGLGWLVGPTWTSGKGKRNRGKELGWVKFRKGRELGFEPRCSLELTQIEFLNLIDFFLSKFF